MRAYKLNTLAPHIQNGAIIRLPQGMRQIDTVGPKNSKGFVEIITKPDLMDGLQALRLKVPASTIVYLG